MTTEEKIFYQGEGIYKIVKGDSQTFISGDSLIPRKGHNLCYGTLTNMLDTTPYSISKETEQAIIHHYLNQEQKEKVNTENSKDLEFTSPSS